MTRQLASVCVLLALVAASCSGPGDATQHNERGAEYLDQGKWNEAISELDQAIEIDPNHAKAYNNRGYAHRELGQWEQALADLGKAIELDPAYATAYDNRGGPQRPLRGQERAALPHRPARARVQGRAGRLRPLGRASGPSDRGVILVVRPGPLGPSQARAGATQASRFTTSERGRDPNATSAVVSAPDHEGNVPEVCLRRAPGSPPAG